jgi:hypothetical protein
MRGSAMLILTWSIAVICREAVWRIHVDSYVGLGILQPPFKYIFSPRKLLHALNSDKSEMCGFY